MVAMRQDARVYKALALRVLLCSPVRRRILPGPVVWRYLRRCLPFCTLCEGGDLLGPQFEGVPKLGRALQDEHRRSVPPSVCSRESPTGGSCLRTSSTLVSSSTSTDHRSPGVLATAFSTAPGRSRPAGRANVSWSISASRTLSSRNSRIPPRRWQWPTAYQ